MAKIFLVPGLGADHRIYQHIDTGGYEAVNVDWVEPDREDTLASYAQKLIKVYHITPGSIIIGNSLGGMLAIEIAKTVPLDKTILISSIKTVDEMPRSFKWFSAIPVYRVLPARLFTKLGFFVRYAFGKMTKGDQRLFIDMLERTSPKFVKWAMGAILHWNNLTIPENVYHITGDKDLVFPHNRIRNATIIHGGTHLMVLNRAKEINKWLEKILPL